MPSVTPVAEGFTMCKPAATEHHQGMTFPTGPRRYADERAHTRAETPADPLTDSGVRRLTLGMGTQVRLHMYSGGPVVVDLLAIDEVTTWRDLQQRIQHGRPISVDRPRMVFAGGVVLWAEDITEMT